MLTPSDRIVVLTGAGISKESGLDTFRDPDGIWARHRLEDVATPDAFARDPALVHRFYNARRRGLLDPAVGPNAGHRALARLERARPGRVLVVTQNIDDLHERGGSGAVIHMHGELLKALCGHCGAVTPCRDDLSADRACVDCGRTGGMRPDIVWFGEMPMAMDRIYNALADCGLFVSIGTSGTVYPAAGFVQEAASAGTPTVELNLEPSEGASLFDEAVHGPASETVPAFVDRVLECR
ncbi:MAG: Sir2 family NAD+-dependent deacetylase [Alphaproteobacteria bacterium]